MLRAAALTALLVAGALLAPLASAQTLTQPLCTPPPGQSREAYCTYDNQYLVMGRVLDVNGNPAKGAQIVASLHQQGTTDAQGNPPTERGVANCKGDFEFSFTGLRHVSGTGSVVVSVSPPPDQRETTTDQRLDSFFRRNDIIVRLPYEWPYQCKQQPDPAWDTQVSVKGRLVNRTAAYEVGGVEFEGRAYETIVGLYLWMDGIPFCPPDGRGGCQIIPTDELGNFKYTWTFERTIDLSDASVEVRTSEGMRFNQSVDASARLAVHHIEATGQGVPEAPIPAPALALMLVAIALAAGARRLLPRDPR